MCFCFSRSSVNFENIESAMMYVTQHAVMVHPCNVLWQQTLGDIYLGKKASLSSLSSMTSLSQNCTMRI